MKVLLWLDENLEKSIGVCLIATMTGLLFLQFVMRRIFNNSLVWSEELARYIFVWMIYIGISYGAKMKQHIKLEMLIHVMPKKIQIYFVIFAEILFLAYAAFIVYASWDLVHRQIILGSVSPALGIPYAFLFAAPTVGFALVIFRQIQVILWRIKEEIKTNKEGTKA